MLPRHALQAAAKQFGQTGDEKSLRELEKAYWAHAHGYSRYRPTPRPKGEWTGNAATMHAVGEAMRAVDIAKQQLDAAEAAQ